MAYGIQNLRRSAVFDQLTPGSPAYGGSGDDYEQPQQQTYEPQDTRILGPDGQPLSEQRGEEPTSNGLAKLADLSVDPNKGNEQERLKGYLDTVQGAYTPDYHSRNRNDNLLDDFPTRQKASGVDKTIAMLMSIGQKDAVDIQDKVLNEPYNRNVADWKMKTEPFYKAAELENRQNINERTLITGAANTFSSGERVNQQQKAADQRYDAAMYRTRVAEAKNNLPPDAKLDVSGTTVKIFNPANGGSLRDTGIPTRWMTEEDKLEYTRGTAESVARIRNEGSANAATIRANASGGSGGGRPTGTRVGYDDEGNPFYWDKANNQWADETRQGKRPIGMVRPVASGSTDSPGNQKIDYRLNMERIYNRNEDGAKEFMVPNSTGGFTIKERPEPGMFGGDVSAKQAQYDRLMKKIDPDYVPPSSGMQNEGAPEGKIPASSRQEKDERVSRGESLYAVDSTGKIVGIVPNSAAGRAEAARLGYKVRGR